MHWLTWPQAPSTMKVDTLLSPVLDAPRLRFDLLPTQRDGTPPATSYSGWSGRPIRPLQPSV
jgi:hypothetical protein